MTQGPHHDPRASRDGARGGILDGIAGKESAAGPARWTRVLLVPLVFVVAFVLFGGGAARRDLSGNDEHRYSEVARVMVENESARLVPHLNGVEYVTKPPGWFWVVAGLAGGLGLDLRAAALLPSVLATAFAAALMVALGRRLFGRVAGLAAALVFATSAQVLSLATEARLDALLAACITLSLSCWALRAFPEPEGGRHRGALLAASGLCAGLGVLIKGPIALAVPGIVIASHILVSHGVRGARPRSVLLWITLALLPVGAWLGAASTVAGLDYAATIVFGHGVGHPLGLVNKQQPIWFYLEALPLGFLPWTLFLPAALTLFFRSGDPRMRSADRFVLCWILAPFVLLSVFPAKRHVYLLPLYPGLALCVGKLLALALETGAEAARRVPRRLLRFGELAVGVLAALIGGACLVAAFGIVLGEDAVLAAWIPEWPVLKAEIDPGSFAWGIVSSALLFGCGALALRARGTRRLLAASAAALAAALFLTRVVYPIESAGQSARPFFEAVRTQLDAHPVAAYGGSDFAPNLLLERERVPVLQDKREADAFLARAEGLVYLVTERSELRRHGLPSGTSVVLEWPRALSSDLILLARRAPRASLTPELGRREARLRELPRRLQPGCC